MPTFSEQDAREVFARAARIQQASEGDPDAPGLTLDELQEIGRAAGLDPSYVAAAAASLGGTPADRPTTRLGVPTAIRRTRRLPGPLSDAAWERIVAHLRDEFGTPGTAGQVGRIREWSGGGDPHRGWRTSRLHVAARPAPHGDTELVVEHRGPPPAAQVALGVFAAFAAMAVVFTGLALALGDLPLVLPLTVGLLAVVTGGVGWASARHSAHQLRAQFEAVLDRAELAAREDAGAAHAAPPERAPEPPRIDLDALGDLAPERAAPTRTRTR